MSRRERYQGENFLCSEGGEGFTEDPLGRGIQEGSSRQSSLHEDAGEWLRVWAREASSGVVRTEITAAGGLGDDAMRAEEGRQTLLAQGA